MPLFKEQQEVILKSGRQEFSGKVVFESAINVCFRIKGDPHFGSNVQGTFQSQGYECTFQGKLSESHHDRMYPDHSIVILSLPGKVRRILKTSGKN